MWKQLAKYTASLNIRCIAPAVERDMQIEEKKKWAWLITKV